MGWAPNLLLTGLCFFAGILTSRSFLVYNRPLLLDNVPLSVAGVTIDIFAFGAVVFGLFWTPLTFCQNTSDTTAARFKSENLELLSEDIYYSHCF